MKRWHDKTGFFVKHYETLLFAGLLCWFAIFQVLQEKNNNWLNYAGLWLTLVLVQLPVLVFSWNRESRKQRFSQKHYWLYWLLCFAVYLPAISIGLSALLKPGTVFQQLVPMSAIGSLLLELLLVATAYYQQRMLQWKWVQRLSLERSVLISIALVSVILSVMAVSSIGNPVYDKPGGLLLGFEFSFLKVISRFGTFLGFMLQFLFMYLCGYFFFYLNNRLLVPKILKQKGVILYILSVFASVGIVYPVIAQLVSLLPANERLGRVLPSNPFVLENGFIAVIIILLSLPFVLAVQWSKQNSRIISLEKEKVQTELDLLKQQLNPHFFFNTLNNLYALSLQQSKQTPESILQLSELMRYVIYKAREPVVSVREEVKYLEDYMQLQQIRLKQKPMIQFNREIAVDTAPIAPLLLMVLVENAFKHGIEPAEAAAFLQLDLKTTANRLYFCCINSFEQVAETTGGIGLANLQRRLALLYPGKHVLKTAIENHTFKAELQLNLS